MKNANSKQTVSFGYRTLVRKGKRPYSTSSADKQFIEILVKKRHKKEEREIRKKIKQLQQEIAELKQEEAENSNKSAKRAREELAESSEDSGADRCKRLRSESPPYNLRSRINSLELDRLSA